MVEIDEIFEARHSSANSRSKNIRVDCRRDDGGEVDTLIRFMIPFEVPSTPDGPKVVVKYDEATVEMDDSGAESIDESEIPSEVKEKAQELQRQIGNW